MSQRKVVVLNPNGSPFYSDAIMVGDFLYVSGQGPIDLETRKTVGEDITTQTTQALENCKAILRKAGSHLGNVIKVSIFLKDMTDYLEMNKVYRKYFPHDPPARSCVGVTSLPSADWKIEIEVISLT